MAAIYLNSVRATIESRLFDELKTAPPVPVVFNNIPYDSISADDFVQCQVNFGSNSYLIQGGGTSSVNSVTGLILLNIYTPEGTGSGANLTIATRIRNLYNRQTVSGVVFEAPVGPETLTGAPDGFYQTQIRISFEVFESI